MDREHVARRNYEYLGYTAGGREDSDQQIGKQIKGDPSVTVKDK